MVNSRTPAQGPEVQSVGRAPAASFDRLAIVYDRGSGEVRHVHRLTSSESGVKLAEADLRSDALRHAEQFHGRGDLAQAEVTLAEVHEWRPDRAHWVDGEGRLRSERRERG
ncbi:hypothetical protein AB2M62_17215 [Sphingomonas sp. MMS12-HWE2-04]|uniref:hypothetical protein n=1 Tax=Sphingomonas sp. MMS12-HWE2-04 TaxID=3234199 RepID=UPI00384F4F4F